MSAAAKPAVVAIIGSRKYGDPQKVRREMRTLRREFGDYVVVSGGAEGVDTWAEEEARKMGLEVIVYRPDYSKHPPRVAPLVRNRKIAESCEMVMAFWDGRSHGTAYTVTYARSIGKSVEVYT